MPLRPGDGFQLLAEGAGVAALVTRVDETTTFEAGVLDHAYDLTTVGARMIPDEPGELPYLAEVLVTPWESDARLLAAQAGEQVYGWRMSGDRFGS